MHCPCFPRKSSSNDINQDLPVAQVKNPGEPTGNTAAKSNQIAPAEVKIRTSDEATSVEHGTAAAQNFTFRELASATKNFKQECLLGEGGFGRVYRGTLRPSGQVVAVKHLQKNGRQESKEFVVEVLVLSLLHHPNLVNLIGYCADGDQRLLVHEYMPLGSLDDHLFDLAQDRKTLDWGTRMKIASGTAEGLEYLHEQANPPVIYRDLKPSNIFLDEVYNPRLSDFGLAKLGISGNKMMGRYGYSAPEYERTGELSPKSDVYSFGVILLELITGRRVLDTTRPNDEQNLVTWAQPIFKEPKRFCEMADPVLKSRFPVKSLNQAVGVAALCLQEEATVRPLMRDIVAAISFLAVDQQGKEEGVCNEGQAACHEISEHRRDSSSDSDSESSENDHREQMGNDQKGESDDDGGSSESSDDEAAAEENQSHEDQEISDCHQNDKDSDSDHEKKIANEQNGQSDDDDDGGGSEYSDHEDDDSFVYLDEDSADERDGKKSKKWGSKSIRKSKLTSHDGSVGSISISSCEEIESTDGFYACDISSRCQSNVGHGETDSSSRRQSIDGES